MSSNNMFYNIYNKKSDEELKEVANSDRYTDDSKLCAIEILKERNIDIKDFVHKEKELVKKREIRIVATIAQKRYNTGFERFVALLIDGFVLGLISWVFKLYNGLESALLISLLGFVELLLPYLYNIILHTSNGQTVGKMFMNVKLFDKDEKTRISFKQAFLRDLVPLSLLGIMYVILYFIAPDDWGFLVYITFVMAFLLIFWSILEIVTMLFDKKKRAMHDYIAGTVVLKMNS